MIGWGLIKCVGVVFVNVSGLMIMLIMGLDWNDWIACLIHSSKPNQHHIL